MDEMKWVKLTLLEASFLRETIEYLHKGEVVWSDDVEQAIDLIDGAVDNAVEEEIDGECVKVPY